MLQLMRKSTTGMKRLEPYTESFSTSAPLMYNLQNIFIQLRFCLQIFYPMDLDYACHVDGQSGEAED